jgi:hypothetical protein
VTNSVDAVQAVMIKECTRARVFKKNNKDDEGGRYVFSSDGVDH